MIPINRPYKPAIESYHKYLESIYKNDWFTNNGPLVRELTTRLEDYLGVKNLLLLANGTLALHVAYRALEVKGAVVTTPFSFIATSSSLEWERLQPRFADIDPGTLNLCPRNVEQILKNLAADAVLPVHVYGNPADVCAFEQMRSDHKIKVIYDAAHAFDVKVNGGSVLNFGDASTLSFHATKVFHCVEGGAIVFRDRDAFERASEIINFGISTKDLSIQQSGMNAKLSEVHAAMGLAILDNMQQILDKRIELFDRYKMRLKSAFQLPLWHSDASLNGSYFPIICHSAELATVILNHLASAGITARRYFSPSLNTVSHYQSNDSCPVSESYATRTLCLPLYYDLSIKEVDTVCSTVLECI